MTPSFATDLPRLSELSSPSWTLPLLIAAAALVLVAGTLVFFAANARAQATGADSPASAQKRTTYDVILSEMGTSEIQVIEQVREVVPGLGLAEAKKLVESAPQPIRQGVTKVEAEAIRQKVESAGAKVTLVSSGGAMTGPTAAGAVESANYDVVLAELGTNKIAVIKEVRDVVWRRPKCSWKAHLN